MRRTELRLSPEAFDKMQRAHLHAENCGYSPTECAQFARGAIAYAATSPTMREGEELVLIVDPMLRGDLWPFSRIDEAPEQAEQP